VNWVLDADIRSFFDSVDHEWLLRMVAGARRKRRASARSLPTSSCTKSPISGPRNGVIATPAVLS